MFDSLNLKDILKIDKNSKGQTYKFPIEMKPYTAFFTIEMKKQLINNKVKWKIKDVTIVNSKYR